MKKSFVKIVSVMLAAVMLVSSACVSAFAADNNYCPSIVIPGVFQSDVNLYDENGNIALNSEGEEYSKPFFLDTTKELVVEAIRDALLPVAAVIGHQEDKDNFAANAIADTAGRLVMGKVLGRDENGAPLYDIHATKYGSVASCNEADKTYIYNQIPLQEYSAVVGEDNLYFFSYNSFDSIKALGEELYQYIQRVKQETGSDKVNIVPISQGGTVANALLELHPEVKNDLNRIVFIVPALNGTNIIGDIFLNGLLDGDNDLYLEMFPKLLGDESEWLGYLANFILRIMPNADLNNILDTVVDKLVNEYIKYSTCMWALVPSRYYEACAEKYLSDEKDAALKAETDWYYQAQLNSKANISAAVDAGVKVFDIVDYNSEMYQIVDSWDEKNADGIINIDSTSMGATSYGVNVQLPEGYVSEGSNCSDPTHNHIDPYNLIDASTGLLPETTFYFYNQNHERTAGNDVIIKLAIKLLIDESFVDVYSYPNDFPQFNIGRNTKGLLRDINRMRSYDLSSLSAEDATELNASIAAVDAQIAKTNVTEQGLSDLEEASDRFYAICNKINNVQPEEETQEGKMKKGFMDILAAILKFFSTIFYKMFGGLGFSEIIKK